MNFIRNTMCQRERFSGTALKMVLMFVRTGKSGAMIRVPVEAVKNIRNAAEGKKVFMGRNCKTLYSEQFLVL